MGNNIDFYWPKYPGTMFFKFVFLAHCILFICYVCRILKPCYLLQMRYVAAYLLAVLGGNESPSSKDLKKILSSVGIDAEDTNVNKVINELKGKSVEDLIVQGKCLKYI